jgi:hypothetical protein
MVCRITLLITFFALLDVVTKSTPAPVSPQGDYNCGTTRMKWALQILCDASSLARCTPAYDRLWAKNKCVKVMEMLEENGSDISLHHKNPDYHVYMMKMTLMLDKIPCMKCQWGIAL